MKKIILIIFVFANIYTINNDRESTNNNVKHLNFNNSNNCNHDDCNKIISKLLFSMLNNMVQENNWMFEEKICLLNNN